MAEQEKAERTAHTPTPWEVVPSTEYHGAYITSPWGNTLCDFYVMSNPSALSVRNGGDSLPVPFVEAEVNAAFIVLAANCHDELCDAVEAALNMVDGDGLPPNWDLMRAALAKARP